MGVGDTLSPLYGIGTATIANIVGDWFFICILNQGIAGAAWATALSSYAGAAVTLSILFR